VAVQTVRSTGSIFTATTQGYIYSHATSSSWRRLGFLEESLKNLRLGLLRPFLRQQWRTSPWIRARMPLPVLRSCITRDLLGCIRTSRRGWRSATMTSPSRSSLQRSRSETSSRCQLLLTSSSINKWVCV
jgi:hypothetical protein